MTDTPRLTLGDRLDSEPTAYKQMCAVWDKPAPEPLPIQVATQRIGGVWVVTLEDTRRNAAVQRVFRYRETIELGMLVDRLARVPDHCVEHA